MFETIDLVPTQPTLPELEWISVRYRIPTQEGRYLVIADGGYDIAFFKEHRFYRKRVTHWMPLPKRPDEVWRN